MSHSRFVLATGGSLVSEPATFERLLETCWTVWLQATPAEHMGRVVAQGDMRPMAGNRESMQDLQRILAGREPLYRRADATVDTSGRPVEQSLDAATGRRSADCIIVLAVLRSMQYNSPTPSREESPMVTIDRPAEPGLVTFDASPERYRHWKLSVDGRVATLALDVDEDAGIRPGYKLKLNSYDLGVDIELHDALNRIRFEHPQVGCVVVTSAKDRSFCAGANIYMLGTSSHHWKVNFCKFTNETRNGMEDSSRHDGLRFVAAVNGACAGGGYEIALACDEILMVDDRSTAVSLPEVPLLGVLPGTGGLTRVGRQAQRAARRRRSVLHQRRRRARRARQGMEARRRDREAVGVRGAGARARRGAAAASSPRRRCAAASRCARWRAPSTAPVIITRTSTSRSIVPRAPRRSPSARRAAHSRKASMRSSPPATHGGRSPSRASSTTRS